MAKELCLKALFDKVGKFWPPRARSKKQLDEEPASEGADAPTEADPPADEVVAGDPEDEEALGVEDEEPSMEVSDGASTPPVSAKMNDEYLAWTLGGGATPNTIPWPTMEAGYPEGAAGVGCHNSIPGRCRPRQEDSNAREPCWIILESLCLFSLPGTVPLNTFENV